MIVVVRRSQIRGQPESNNSASQWLVQPLHWHESPATVTAAGIDLGVGGGEWGIA